MRFGRSKQCTLFALGIILFVFMGASLDAQTTGEIIGTVLDETAGAIPGAQVVATHQGTAVSFSVTTGGDGSFRIPQVPIGIYDITAKFEGFRTLVRRDVEVITGRTTDLRLQLSLGQVTEEVEVIALTPTVQTSTVEVQETIDRRAMVELPLNGRNPLQLLVLTAGAKYNQVGQFSTPRQGGFQQNRGVSVNGLGANENNYRLDAADYNNILTNSAPLLPNPDALQEFTVKTSNYSAKYARAGAVVEFSTRSGTNEVHGGIFWFLRNDKLDARPFFASAREHFVRNQAGATIGVPIKRDKTFVFGSVQFTRLRGDPNIRTLTVPTAAERAGDFSGQRPIFDETSGEPIPNNQVPASRIDPIGKQILDLYPLPAPGSRRITRPVIAKTENNHYLSRVDHYFSSRHQINTRFFLSDDDNLRDTNSIAEIFGEPDFDNWTVGINDTYTFSPSFLLTNSFSYTRTETLLQPQTPLTLQEMGVTYPLGTSRTPREMRVLPTGLTRLFSGGELASEPQVYEFKSHASWLKGSHSIQFGADIQRMAMDSFDFSTGSGQFRFDGSRTSSPDVASSGLPTADVLLGLPNRFDQRAGAFQEFRENKFHFWFHDNWKIHPRLTLDFGLRYEPWLPYTEKGLPLTGFLPGVQSSELPAAPTGLVFAGSGLADISGREKILANDLNNFAPRFGFAWDMWGDGKTAFRGAYGVFYRAPMFNLVRFTIETTPFGGKQITIFDPGSLADPFINEPNPSPFPFTPPPASELVNFEWVPPVNTTALDPNSVQGYVQNWNATIERELYSGLTLSLGYVGNRGQKGMATREANPAVFGPGATAGNTNARRLFADLARVNLVTSGYESSNYHSLQVRVDRRSPTGLNVISSYVFSKTININGSATLGGFGWPRDPFNLQLDRGRADTHNTHFATISLNYPFANTTKDGLAGAILNGWQVNGIINARSGNVLNITAGRNRSLTGVNRDTADLIGDPELNNPAIDRWFNTEAFALPALGTVGTAGRNILSGPNFWGVDFSVFKDFPVNERVRFQFRTEMFNAFNHTNFENPTGNFSSGNFGRILGSEDPRVIQMALKLMF